MYGHDHRDYLSSGVIAAALILGIIVTWMAVLVPSHAAPSRGSHATDVAVSIVSNTARKGDRLDAGRNTIEQGARFAPAPTAKAGATVPVGCDVAFSKLVRFQNVAVRCMTSVATSVKFAQALDTDRAL